MYELFGLYFPDFHEVARSLVAKLRNEGASPIVVLSHLGLGDDRLLAHAVAGIDLIIGAHSHDRLLTGEECNGVLIAQAGQFAEALGRVDLTFDAETGAVVSRSAQVIDVPPNEPPDPVVVQAIEAAEREVEVLMAKPIGVLGSPLDLDHFQECGLGNLAADALREHFGAEIAIVSSGLFHKGLESGTLTFGALDGACFTAANPCVTEMRGEQIIWSLERGLDPAVSQTKHQGFRGTPVGIPQIGGMVVEYDPGGNARPRVQRVVVQGTPLDLKRLYRVAHTDAETIPEIAYFSLEDGQKTTSEAPIILREVIEAYVRRHSPVPLPEGERWRPVP
jgi:2',3'-cyclic-nucleotide 2'-phosphodiesterase (5'-nucleotidase family)